MFASLYFAHAIFQYLCPGMKKILLIIFTFGLPLWGYSQFQPSGQGGRPGSSSQQPQGFPQQPGEQGPGMDEEQESSGQQPFIPREVKNWKLKDDFSRVDTIPVDTMQTSFQIYNPVYQESIANVYLSNLGSAAQSALIEDQSLYNSFLFARNLSYWLTSPEDWHYYNTRTPYTNLYYQHGGPKRRSEEHVGVLFTQNVNPDWNVGFRYKLISSVGKYEAQQADNRFFRFFSSYDGDRYTLHGSFVYGKTDHLKSGGLLDDDYIFNPDHYDYDQPENIPVIFMDASDRIDNYQLFVDQKLDIGSIDIAVNDTLSKTTPLATLSHTFELDHNRRIYRIDDLSAYFPENEDPVFYTQRFIDEQHTRDSVYQTTFRNTFQLRFNEEANPFLRFGMRVYLMNEVERNRWPAPSEFDEETEKLIYYHDQKTRNATALGGQLFKNLGENFFYDGGLRVWFQGHKAGDSEITGGFNSRFRIKEDTTGLFARGGIYLNSPGFFTEKYYSNHFKWEHRFSSEKTIKLRGGLTVPTRNLKLSGEVRLIDDYIYWNEQALPQQTNAFIQLIDVSMKKHLNLGNVHSRNEIHYQVSSHNDIIPVPEVALYTSNYYENVLFEVLRFQLGFDLRYHSAYFAPDYMPATGQFFIQRQRKTGNYPVVDPFVTFHLKRANIFVKYEHINQGFPNSDYFHTIGYPVNPRGIRFGLSWNFYD